MIKSLMQKYSLSPVKLLILSCIGFGGGYAGTHLYTTISRTQNTDLEFYGFFIGETLANSIENMNARGLTLISQEEATRALYQSKTTELVFNNPDRCSETEATASGNSLNTYICHMSNADISDFNLYFINNRLIRISADVPLNKADQVFEKLQSKYSKNLIPVTNPNQNTDAFANHLTNIYGISNSCDNCTLSRIAFGSKANLIALKFEAKNLKSITLLNTETISTEIDKYESNLKRNIASEDKRKEF